MAPPHLTDEQYQSTGYIVIDFEAPTPTGHRLEPVNVAALALRGKDRQLVNALDGPAWSSAPTGQIAN